MPLAAHGELCRGGAGPGRDESGRPARIADRFVPHPWSALPGALLYRAGDRVRRLADGRLRFVSRLEPSEVHGSRAGSADRETHGESGAPSTATEELLAQIWAEVLELEQVGREDDFFDLGGHSLLATQVIARIADQLGVEISLRTLFARPTLGALAEAVTGAQAEPAWTS